MADANHRRMHQHGLNVESSPSPFTAAAPLLRLHVVPVDCDYVFVAIKALWSELRA